MSFSDFRQIASPSKTGKSERLFRSAISAFCSLTRPSRREIAQLDDLTLPLFDSVSPEGLRFAAAALSECEFAPPGLVKHLSESQVGVAAPLLTRSHALSDLDLITLIGRHGLAHARAIARRKDLHPAIASLIRALERQEEQTRSGGLVPIGSAPTAGSPAIQEPTAKTKSPRQAEEATRAKLRQIMVTPTPLAPANSNTYTRLRDTALSGNPSLFQTAFADALSIGFSTARAMTQSSDHTSLIVGLRMLNMSEPEAYLIASAVCESLHLTPKPVSSFLEHYRNMSRDDAARKLSVWVAKPIDPALESHGVASLDARSAS